MSNLIIKNSIIIPCITLLVGLFLGYIVAVSSYQGMSRDGYRLSGHMMPSIENASNYSHSESNMHMMNSGLSGKTGDAFDKEFITEMMIHHEGAVAMAQLALQKAQHQEIKDLAAAIIIAQNKEIDDMKIWYKKWFGVDLK